MPTVTDSVYHWCLSNWWIHLSASNEGCVGREWPWSLARPLHPKQLRQSWHLSRTSPEWKAPPPKNSLVSWMRKLEAHSLHLSVLSALDWWMRACVPTPPAQLPLPHPHAAQVGGEGPTRHRSHGMDHMNPTVASFLHCCSDVGLCLSFLGLT